MNHLLVLGLSAEYGAGHHALGAGHGVLLLVLLVRSDLAQSFTDILPSPLLTWGLLVTEAVTMIDVLDGFPQLLQTHHSNQSSNGGNIGMVDS